MNPVLAAALFFITWWLCFFMVLPIGVRPIDETAAETKGHDTGAPETPNLGRKAIWAALAAFVVWGAMMLALNALYYNH